MTKNKEKRGWERPTEKNFNSAIKVVAAASLFCRQKDVKVLFLNQNRRRFNCLPLSLSRSNWKMKKSFSYFLPFLQHDRPTSVTRYCNEK